MKKILLVLFAAMTFSVTASAQKYHDILATAEDVEPIALRSLEPQIADAAENLEKNIAEMRSASLENQIANMLFDTEAAARKINKKQLFDIEIAKKTAAPTDAQIQAVYDQNRDQIGDQTLADVRSQIVSFLRNEAELQTARNFVAALRKKYAVTLGKDVNAPNLAPTDVLASVGARKLTAAELEEKIKPSIYEMRLKVYAAVMSSVMQTLYSNLVLKEASKQKIAPEIYIKREITDRLTEGSDEEQQRLQALLQDKLFRQYKVKYYLAEPPAPVQNISTDDDPARGRIDAKVKVVMFTDFQCPACARVHPVLKKVLERYGDDVRFVVRDFPLAEIHKNALLAAQAANAQGKFFEYIELLYANQDALDAASLKRYAVIAGLDAKRFAADLDSGKFADEVRKDREDGEEYGITGTPTVFINGVRVRELSEEAFSNAIRQILNR